MAKKNKVTNQQPQTIIMQQPINKQLEILHNIVEVNNTIADTNKLIAEKLGNISMLAFNGNGTANISNCSFITRTEESEQSK